MHDGSTGPFLCQMHHILSVTKQNEKKKLVPPSKIAAQK
jgi:hypothetical protein